MKQWPDGCHDTDSCERHRICMYRQCVHTGKGAALGGEIDAAIRALIDAPTSGVPDPRDAASELSELLAEALNLCVRARKIDSVIPRPGDDPLMTRSATTALWVQDQYDTDLASWETRARKALS